MAGGDRRSLMTKSKITPYLLTLPMLVLYILFIGGGLGAIILESLGHIPVLGLRGFSLKAYSDIVLSKGFSGSILYSTYIAITSAVIATVLGTLIAYFLISCNNKFLQDLVKRALQLGVILPYIYVVFLAMIFLNQSGFFARLLYGLGFISDASSFPELIFDRRGFGIMWVFVFKGTPFIAIFALNIMARVSCTYGEVAKTLGSGGLHVLRRIYLPLCENAIVWASCILLAYALGSFEVNYLLSSISPVPLAARLYSLFINPNVAVIPQTMAMNVILLIMGGALVYLYGSLMKLLIRRLI